MRRIVTYATGIRVIRSYLQSGLRYKFLSFGTSLSDTVYLFEQMCEDS